MPLSWKDAQAMRAVASRFARRGRALADSKSIRMQGLQLVKTSDVGTVLAPVRKPLPLAWDLFRDD